MDSSTTTLWTGLFPKAGCLVSFYDYYALKKISVCNATCVESDQTPHSVASDLGLDCLTIILLRVSRLKCLKSSILYKSIAGRYRPVS